MMDKSIAVTWNQYLKYKHTDKQDLQLCFIHQYWETNKKESLVVKLSQMFADFLHINHSPQQDESNYKLHQTFLLKAPFEN